MTEQADTRGHVIGVYRNRARRYDITAKLYYLIGFPQRSYRRKAVQALCRESGERPQESALTGQARDPTARRRTM